MQNIEENIEVNPSEQDLQGRPNGFGEWQDNSYHGEVCHENHWNSNGRVIARPLRWSENPQLSILGQFFLCGQAFVQGHPEIKNPHISKHKSGDGKGFEAFSFLGLNSSSLNSTW